LSNRLEDDYSICALRAVFLIIMSYGHLKTDVRLEGEGFIPSRRDSKRSIIMWFKQIQLFQISPAMTYQADELANSLNQLLFSCLPTFLTSKHGVGSSY